MIKLKPNFNALLVGIFVASMSAAFIHHKTAAHETYDISSPASALAVNNEISPQFKAASIKEPQPMKIKAGLSETVNPNPLETEAGCATDCQNRILKLLSKGANLTPVDAKIIVQNPEVFAPLLAAAPATLAKLLSELQQDEGEHDHAQFAAYAILEALSDDNRASTGQALIEHKNPAFRVIGIKLGKDSMTHDVHAARALNSLIKKDKNNRVLITALETLTQENKLGPHASETVVGLNHLISFHKSDHIRGRALVAKVTVMQSTPAAKADIHSALSSPSAELQKFGLEAFAVAQKRQNLQSNSENKWTRDKESIASLQALIQNTDLDSELRQLAGELAALD